MYKNLTRSWIIRTVTAEEPTPGGGGENGQPAADAPKFEAITSQEALDKIVGQRLARDRAKITSEYGDLAALKDKAAKFDAGEREKLDEVDRLKADLAAANTRAQLAEFASTRAEVAASKGVPAGSLTGSTREELEASADTLIAWRDQNSSAPKPPPPDPKNLRSGATGGGSGGGDPKAAAAEALRSLRAN